MELKTALYEEHIKNNGKIVPFAGYLLPIQYDQGVIKEHNAVRTQAGIFDVSHMSEFWIRGERAAAFLDELLSNQIATMRDGQIKYTLMLYEEGGIVDDLLVYRQSEISYMLVANAANHDKDLAWIMEHLWEDVSFDDASSRYSQLAIQGPNAIAIVKELVGETNIPQKYYTFLEDVMIDGVSCLISRNGYTGEDGVELYFDPKHTVDLYRTLLSVGEKYGLIPCGLGARDTLRLEAGMPLYGHEMSKDITPYEVGLGFFVKMNKENFIGKAGLLANPGNRRRVGLRPIDRGILREECIIYHEDHEIGVVTSGTQLPFVNYAGAMGMVPEAYAALGTKLLVDVRGRKLLVEVVSLPFYQRAK